MPAAAIESLILGLAATPATTTFETLDLISRLTKQLKSDIPNSVSLTAGTDLFQKYLEASLQGAEGGSTADFGAIRSYLVQNGKLVVENAKAAREQAATCAQEFISEGNTILTNGGSRVVGTLLKKAADEGKIRFRVIYVVASDGGDSESEENITALRQREIPVAVIAPTAVAYCMSKVSKVFVGAEGVVKNGGIISRMGTFQMAQLARVENKPFYVVVETHKFTRLFPSTQTDLGFEQKVLDFYPGERLGNNEAKDEGVADMDGSSARLSQPLLGQEAAVDYTPPHLISAVITEIGVKIPAAVGDMITRMWM